MERGGAVGISIGRLVSAFDQVAGLLKFDREEESARGTDPLSVTARRIGAALIDLIVPEGEAGGVGSPVQKVCILLAHKEIGLIDRVVVRCVGQTTRVVLYISRNFAD